MNLCCLRSTWQRAVSAHAWDSPAAQPRERNRAALGISPVRGVGGSRGLPAFPGLSGFQAALGKRSRVTIILHRKTGGGGAGRAGFPCEDWGEVGAGCGEAPRMGTGFGGDQQPHRHLPPGLGLEVPLNVKQNQRSGGCVLVYGCCCVSLLGKCFGIA